MLGAIAGDMIGSVHEFVAQKSTEFPLFLAESRFTDDTVLTVAVADCLLTGSSYVDRFREYSRAYPRTGITASDFGIGCSLGRASHTTVGVTALQCE